MFSKGKDVTRVLWQSSALRLTLWMSVIFALVLTLTGIGAYFFAADALESDMEATLESEAILLAAYIGEGLFDDEPFEANNPYMSWAVFDDGRLVTYETQDDDDFHPANLRQLRNSPDGFDEWREWHLFTLYDDDIQIVTAMPTNALEDTLETLRSAFVLALVIGLTAAVLVGGIFGRSANARFSQLTHMLQRFSAGDLSARVDTAQKGDDIDSLASQINQMASQIEKLVDQTRRMGANMAHDLRTPIARLSAHLESADLQDDPAPSIEQARTELTRLSAVIDTILRIARIEGSQSQDSFETIDLCRFAHEFAEDFGALAEDVDRRFTVKCTEAATIHADRGLVVQAMANLLQNALRYGDGDITLHVNGASVMMADQGPGVPDDHHDKIVQPLFRMDDARHSEGAGLGLAMVAAIADRHAATLTFERTSDGFGARLDFT